MNPTPKPERKKKIDRSALHKKACAEYRKEFYNKYGFLFCENCKIVNAVKFEVHHIFSAGQKPKHPELHNPFNLILLCNECHDGFHLKLGGREQEFRDKKESLIIERGLKELFDIV